MEDYDTFEKWNMAESFLRRIDSILWECKLFRNNGNLDSWYKALDCLFIEVGSKLKPAAQKQVEKLLIASAMAVANFRKNNGNVSTEKRGELVLNLRKIDIELHKALDEKGLLTPRPPDARSAINN
jgi:hypothetical protein